MEAQLKEFYQRGYIVIKFALPTRIAEQALAEAGGLAYANIFKDAIGDSHMDPFRSQAVFSDTAPFKWIQTSITDLVELFNMGWSPRNWVVIWSKAGGGEQAPHQDFPKREVTHAMAGVGFKYDKKTKRDKEVRIRPTIQAGIIISLMPATKLIIYDRCFNDADMTKKKELLMDAGECVIFRGDLVHAGAAFAEDNYRIHATLVIPEVPWDPNATEAVPIRDHKCRFCPKRMETQRAINAHIQFCQANPERENHLRDKRARNRRPKKCERCGVLWATQSIYYKHRPKCIGTNM